MLLLALTLLCTLFASLTIGNLLRLRPGAEALVGLGVLAYAQAVGVAHLVSLRPWLSAAALAGLHAALATVALVIWLRRGRPRLWPWSAGQPRRFLQLLRRYAPLMIAGGAALLSLCAASFLVLYVPPNTWDAMTCHLARAAFWMQHQQVADFPSHNPLHNDYPRGASILQMYALIFVRGDYLAGFVQLLSWVWLLPCVYGLARALRVRRRAALLAGLLICLMPQPLLQSTSTQIDLLFAWTVAASLFLMLRAAQRASSGLIVISGVAAGLMLSTKGTALLLAPLFVTLLLAAIWSYQQRPLIFLLRYALLVLPLILVVGGESYVDNLHELGTLNRVDALSPISAKRDAQQIRANLIRCGVDAFELPFETYDITPDKRRIPAIRALGRWLGANVDDTSDRRAMRLEDTLYRTVHEDVSWFGLTGFVLLPVGALAALLAIRRAGALLALGGIAALLLAVAIDVRAGIVAALLAAIAAWLCRDRATPQRTLAWLLAANLLAHVLTCLGTFMFMNSINRYLLPAAVLAAPLAARLLDRRGPRGVIVGVVVAGIGAAHMLDVHLHNERKPMAPSIAVTRMDASARTIFDLPRERRRATVRPMQADMARTIDSARPPIERLGYVSHDGDSWDFPFFGPHLAREVVLLDWRGDWLTQARQRGLDWIVLMNVPYSELGEYQAVFEPAPGQYAVLQRKLQTYGEIQPQVPRLGTPK